MKSIDWYAREFSQRIAKLERTLHESRQLYRTLTIVNDQWEIPQMRDPFFQTILTAFSSLLFQADDNGQILPPKVLRPNT